MFFKGEFMLELKKIYARMILKVCLCIKKDQPLFIASSNETIDFVRILASEAYNLGVNDIYFDITDDCLKHDMLKELDFESLKKSSYFNKSIWNDYAKRGAAFIMLASVNPGLMSDIDSDKLNKVTMYSYNTRKEFDDMRSKLMVPWIIVGVPSINWAKKVFPNSSNPLNDLWDSIFNICYVNKPNPEKYLEDKLERLNYYKNKLNKYHFKKIIYSNKLGTNFSIELHPDSLWVTGRETLKSGESILVNYPTEEIFTSPLNNSANGIVYASKPLCYHDILIKDFYLEFKDGVVTNYGASEGEETLKQIINSCPNANRLGEVALVENSSSISQSNILFYETLFDENASCHLALGESFNECLKNGTNMSREELMANHFNQCDNHVDFMIGTSDLSIKGITFDNQEIDIFINGNFNEKI